MAQINQSEAAGELTEQQAENLRLRNLNQFDADRANIDNLKASAELATQSAEKLRLTNPGSVKAQDAETRAREAQARLADAQRARQELETRQTEALGNLPVEELKLRIQDVRQKIARGEPTIDIPGIPFKITPKEYLDTLEKALSGREAGGGITEQNRIQNQRQEKLDEEKRLDDADKAENIIRNKPEADNTVEAETFNRHARKDFMYLAKPNTGWTGPNNRVVKIPIPKIKTLEGGEKTLDTRTLYNMWRMQTAFRGMTLKEFLVYVYQNMAKQPLPPELAD
jgi:hypothetical protein